MADTSAAQNSALNQLFSTPSSPAAADMAAYRRWVRERQGQVRPAVGGVGAMRDLGDPDDPRYRTGAAPQPAAIPGLVAPEARLTPSYLDDVAAYMARKAARDADTATARALLRPFRGNQAPETPPEQLPLAFRGEESLPAGIAPAGSARVLDAVPPARRQTSAQAPAVTDSKGIRPLTLGEAEEVSLLDAHLQRARARAITADDLAAVAAAASAADGPETLGLASPLVLGDLVAAAEEVQSRRQRPSIEGDPAQLELSTQASPELAPYSQVQLPVVDAQGRLNTAPSSFQAVYPSEIAYSRTVDPDATAIWDLQEDVSVGKAIGEAADARKTPVITYDGLAAAYKSGRYRLATPAELQAYAPEGDRDNTLHGFLQLPGSDAETPVFKPGVKTTVDRVAYTNDGRPYAQQVDVDLFRVGLPTNRDATGLREDLKQLSLEGRGLPGVSVVSQARRVSPRVLMQALGSGQVQVSAGRVRDGGQVLSPERLEQVFGEILARAEVNPETRQAVLPPELPQLYVQRPDGGEDLIVPVVPPGPERQLLLQVTTPGSQRVTGPAVLSDQYRTRRVAESLRGAPDSLEGFVREMAAGGFAEGAPIQSREVVVRGLLRQGLTPEQVLSVAAQAGAGPTELEFTRQALVSATNQGREVDLFADSVPELDPELLQEQALRDEAARAANPVGYGYAQFGDGAEVEGKPGETRYGTVQTEPETRDALDRRLTAVALQQLAGAGLTADDSVRKDLERQAALIADAARREASPTVRRGRIDQGAGDVTELAPSGRELLARVQAMAARPVQQVQEPLVGLRGAGAVRPNPSPTVVAADDPEVSDDQRRVAQAFAEWVQRPESRAYLAQKSAQSGGGSAAAALRSQYQQAVPGMRSIDFTGYGKALGLYDQPEIQEAAMAYQAERLQRMQAVNEQASARPRTAATNTVQHSELNAPAPPETSPAQQADALLRRRIGNRLMP